MNANLIDGRFTEADFNQDRTLRGYKVRLTKKRCDQCNQWTALFTTTLEPGRYWAHTSHNCSGPGIGSGGWAGGDGEQLRPLVLPPTDRQELGERIAEAKGRKDNLGDLMAEALAKVEKRLPEEPKRLFELGSVMFSSFFQRPEVLTVPTQSFVPVLTKHQAGDFGTLGTVADFPEITEDAVWCPEAFGGLVPQAVAIREGRGSVVSGHVVDYPTNGFLRSVEVVIRTTLSPGGNSTTIRPIQLNKFTLPTGLPQAVAASAPAHYDSDPPQRTWATR